MRLLFLSSTFPDESAPARGTYNAALCCALAEGHQIHAISPRTFSESWRAWSRRQSFRPSPQLTASGISADYPCYWYTPKLWRASYGKQMWWSIRGCIQRALKQCRPEAVVSYWAHPEGEVGLLTARLAGVPSVVIVGGTDVLLLPHEPGRGRIIHSVLNGSSAVVGISEGLRQATIGLGVRTEHVHTIYQGIDPDVFHPHDRSAARERLAIPASQKMLLWVGRMVPIKAVNVLIDSMARVREQRQNVHLVLVGDGPGRTELEQQVRLRGLETVVTFAGAIGHDRIADWFRAADATVLCSLSEGLPNVLRESLACGTPFVSTDVGSVREIADETYSRLVPSGDACALAQALIQILDPRFASAASSYRPRTWKDSAHELSGLIQHLVRQQGTSSKRGTTRIESPVASVTP